jgi:hypothetical protein
MIRLEWLVSAFNEILGTDKYNVYLNSNAYPDATDPRTIVTMNVLRVPFGYTTEEFDAEQLNVTLTFDLPCDLYGEDVVIRDNALAVIEEKLLGHKRFNVVVPLGGGVTETYVCDAFFEQQPPANPYADSGRITQQLVLSGKVLARNANVNAVIGNDVKVYINGMELLKVSNVATVEVGADSNIPLSSGSTLPETHGISRTPTKALTFLYTGKEIEDEFIFIAEGGTFDVNKIYDYKVAYPNFIATCRFKVRNVSIQASAGVYLQYTLNVTVVEELKKVEVSE